MAAVNGAITQAEKSRGKEFTPKQKKFLQLYAKNNFQNIKECAEKAGYKQHYWSLINTLKDEIKEIAESVLLGSAPEAAMSITELLTSDKPVLNAQTKLQAAKEVLDRSGVIKKEKVEHDHKVHGGIFLLPVKHEIPTEQADDYIEGEVEGGS